MKFYFCEKYINAEADDKKVKRDMYATLHVFEVLMISMGMRSEKSIWKIFSVILF